MQHTKTGSSIHQNFWRGILVCLVVGCPFLATADEQDTQPNTQETTDEQNQDSLQLIQKGITNMLREQQKVLTTLSRKQGADVDELLGQQEALRTQFTISVVILGFLLLAILIFLVWMLLQYKTFVRELGQTNQTNRILGQNFSNIDERIQDIERNFDLEVLYQKLAADNETRTQEVLKRLEPLINLRQNDVSSTQEAAELSQQHESPTDEERLSSEIVEFCNRYNAGIQHRQNRVNFMKHYGQNHKIDVENAEERFFKPQMDIEPIFKAHPAGCFLACYLAEAELYAVVPTYGLVIGDMRYIPGAFGDVFECSNFDSRLDYQVLKLVKPALFEPDDRQETWRFQERGVLELQET